MHAARTGRAARNSLLIGVVAMAACVAQRPAESWQQSSAGSGVRVPAASTAAAAGAALAGNAATYVGSERCATCHRPEYLRVANTLMGRQLLLNPRNDIERLGCESCHGPGSAHVEVEGTAAVPGFLTFAHNDPAPVAERNQACLQCHEGTKRIEWQGSPHELRDLACTDCHTIMTRGSAEHQLEKRTVLETCGQCHARQAKSQQFSMSRMPLGEGKMKCTSCHNPHGSANERLLVAATVNDVCYSCHAEKRGPFMWEHAPVAENCANCHDPHGSRHEKMLAVPKPRLCQQCHVERSHPTGPQSTAATRIVMGRQCVNCHFNIHGSNHPGGARFTR
jgi:DmsE family decaheme c-type cytochrome